MNTKTREEYKQAVEAVNQETEQLRTVNDIIDFYKNRKS